MYLLYSQQLFGANAVFLLLILLVTGVSAAAVYAFMALKKIKKVMKELTDTAFNFSRNDFSVYAKSRRDPVLNQLSMAINKLGKVGEVDQLMDRHNSELLNHILFSLNSGVLFLHADGAYEVLNNPAREFLDSCPEVDKESRLPIVLHRAAGRVQAQKQGLVMEAEWEQRFFSLTLTPLLSASETVHGILVLIEEVTEERKLDVIRGDFITNVSHDLRTPLQTIQGYSEAILDNIAETAEEKNEMARIIYEEATEMNRTVNNLLELSRYQAGKSQLDIKAADTEEMLLRVSARFVKRFHDLGIRYTYSIDRDAAAIWVDADKFNQVLYNLIDNAIRYSDSRLAQGEKVIHISVSADLLLNEVIIEVKDNGIGIDKSQLQYIFEKFYKADTSRTAVNQSGSGIGLSIVQSIVEAHHGYIHVESAVGEGTSFIIHLPYHKEMS